MQHLMDNTKELIKSHGIRAFRDNLNYRGQAFCKSAKKNVLKREIC